MDFHDYFSLDENKSVERLIKDIHYFGQILSNMHSESASCYGSPFNINYYEYLAERNLSDEPMNAKAVYDYIAELFNGMPDWRSPKTMLNVIPPASEPSLVAGFMAERVNANISHDEYSGMLAISELEVVKYMAELVHWDWERAAGVFTFGGKGTNLYALRCAMVNAYPEGKKCGFKKKYFFIASAKGHPCYAEDASWLGLGSDACVKISTDGNGKMRLDEAETKIREHIKAGEIFLGFIAIGGTTVELEVDNIAGIAELRDKIKLEYSLDYTPWIHVDAVVGWLWLFFDGYDFDCDSLGIGEKNARKILSMYQDIREINLADSFGIDFHKTGFCSYISSLFLSKNRENFYNLGEQPCVLELKNMHFGSYAPFEQTLELTRSAKGCVSALSNLKLFGKNGFRALTKQLTESTTVFRELLSELPYIELLNENSRGIATLFFIKPPEYVNLSQEKILALPLAETDKIKNYNLSFTDFIIRRCYEKKSGFIFTASDVFSVRDTGVVIGMIKAYSLSLLADENALIELVKEIDTAKSLFDTERDSFNSSNHYKPVDMVYRREQK